MEIRSITKPVILCIFGATGDLTRSKLLPSLYNLDKKGLLSDRVKILAVARRNYSREEYIKYVSEDIAARHPNLVEPESWAKFLTKLDYEITDLEQADYSQLSQKINTMDSASGFCAEKIFYLAVSPDLYRPIIMGIKGSPLKNICDDKSDLRIVIEKPFGKDLQSFEILNNELLEVFDEEQIYRVDHYLAKETVQNITYFRSSNPLMTSDWDNKTIESIEIDVLESIGVGTRAGYYDQYGQLKDMVQSHCMQLLALSTMRVHDSVEFAAEKLRIIENLKINHSQCVRGQYGANKEADMPGYQNEPGVAQGSATETFVKLQFEIDLPEWRGVPIWVRTGKRSTQKLTQVSINFKAGGKEGLHKNKLVFDIQPNEKISLHFQLKNPSSESITNSQMEFNYKEAFSFALPEAYEKIIGDAIGKRRQNFLSATELEDSWKLVDGLIEYWAQNNTPLIEYKAGTNLLLN